MPDRLKKKWTLIDDIDESKVAEFAKDINVPASISRILLQRGITTNSEAKSFFVPILDQLYDPYLMKDMDKAVNRLLEVIKNKEKVLVFGDYDVDGTSGVSMFRIFLNRLGVPNEVFLPDRFTDGYGVSNSGIDFAWQVGIKLIISIDCGITAFDKVEYAKPFGIDFIICDHHQPPESIPDALAVLDPMRDDCSYPFKYLCGAGVAFKLIQAVCQKLNLDIFYQFIDFVAVATAADMVPVTNENRILLHYGFEQIKSNPRPSFITLIKNAGFKLENLGTSNVVFALGPRINAVGRLGDATRAVEFLTCDNISEAESLAGVLETENMNRKKIDNKIYLQALDSYEDYKHNFIPGDDDVAIVLHNPEWHPGVLGIIASRMVEKYYRPSIILTTFNGNAKGSARSVNNFNIYEALRKCSEKFTGLIQFGGHYHAAGLEVELERIDEFRECFNKVAKEIIENSELGGDILIPEIKIDAQIELRDINKRFVKILKLFEPFGPSNMTPLFLTENVQVVGEPRIYNGTTCVFKVRKPLQDQTEGHLDTDQAVDGKKYSYRGDIYECIYFKPASASGSREFDIKTGSNMDIVYSVDENHWNNRIKTQLRIRDYKIIS